jgi:slit protein 2
MLHGLQEIDNLQLDHNEISCIEADAINGLNRLEIVTLNFNNLTTLPVLPLARLIDLRVLRLHDNQFVCDCRLLWLAKYLKSHPFLGLNARCQDGDTFNSKDITSLIDDEKQCNSMDVDDIDYTCNVPVCPYPCTCFNGVVDCKDKDLIEIPRNIPDNTIELRLEKNRILEIPPKIFSHLKKLRRLDISNNLISTIYPDSFAGLKSLNSLILSNNQLVHLPLGLFHHEFTHLQLL